MAYSTKKRLASFLYAASASIATKGLAAKRFLAQCRRDSGFPDQIGPVFFPPKLDGEKYVEFLQEQLTLLLEDVPLLVRKNMIFQHDGAPAHFHRNTRTTLDAQFPDRWMGRGGPITWPARSPDLTPLDFFLWGHIKNLVENERGGREEEVRAAIIAAFQTLTSDMVHRATRDIVRRAELCVQQRGRQFEHL
ncbi:uncharacterized protein [Prorops nasuta]|uniref:uncharacterized protein n=1 Tax=Prorops nasuta TaxID=863751 RepID=UPI0034CF7924